MEEKEIRDTIDIVELGLAEKEDVLLALDAVSSQLEEMKERSTELCNEIENIEKNIDSSNAKNELPSQLSIYIFAAEDQKKELREIERKIVTYSDYEKDLQTALLNFKNFNKKRCIENIKALIKDSADAKIGVIEKEAGVSLGYLSRLDKDDNKTDPSIEFIMAAAKILKVSIDSLVKYDFANMSSTQQYYISFLERLREQTETQQLDWGRESKDELNRINKSDDHPLFSYEEYYREGIDEYPEYVEKYVFVSHTFNCDTYICDDCYYLKMKDNSTLYFMSISKGVYRNNDQSAFAKEMWLFKPDTGSHFVLDNRGDKEISALVDTLYDLIKEYMKHPNVDKDVKNVIDAFMNGDFGQNDDELPFN